MQFLKKWGAVMFLTVVLGFLPAFLYFLTLKHKIPLTVTVHFWNDVLLQCSLSWRQELSAHN